MLSSVGSPCGVEVQFENQLKVGGLDVYLTLSVLACSRRLPLGYHIHYYHCWLGARAFIGRAALETIELIKAADVIEALMILGIFPSLRILHLASKSALVLARVTRPEVLCNIAT